MELRERVAKTIYDTAPHYRVKWNTDKIEWADLPADNPYTQESYLAMADAAISALLDAMQEPSEGMLAQTGHDDGMNEAPLHDWQAMLTVFRTEALPPVPPEHTLRP